MGRRAMVPVITILLAFGGRPVAAQEMLEAGTRTAVAEAAAQALEDAYVWPDVGRELAQILRDRAGEGAWHQLAEPADFARQLTAELNAIADDLHLRVIPPTANGGGAPGMPGRRIVRRAMPPADVSTPPTSRRPPVDRSRDLPSTYRVELPEGADPAMRDRVMAGIAARVADERRQNHFFKEAEVLRGNVGYLDLDQFPIMPDAAPAADAAMLFLADVDAFILDLRGNPGGGEGMNQYLSSFFFADSVPLYARYYRQEDETREYWSRPELPPIHLPDVPLYVLIDGGSGSAAENMAFSLRNAGRATLVGETTAGAGHSSTVMELPGGFSIQVPIARVYDPRTDQGFEGTGVQPDIVVEDGESAAARAHLMAIDDLIARTSDPARANELQEVAALIRAHALPPLTDAELAEYAGDYGNRRVWAEDGRLLLQRTDVPDARQLGLLHVGDDGFVLEAMVTARIEFTRDDNGRVRSIRVLQPTGQWDESERQ